MLNKANEVISLKRRTLALTIVLTIAAALTLWYIVGSSTPSESERKAARLEYYKENWGIQLSEPDLIETIWSSRGWFGDGESITVMEYVNSNLDLLKQDMNLITDANLEMVNGMISKFIKNTLSMHSTSTELKHVFEQHNVEVDIHDYYHKQDRNRTNYIIAVYKQNDQKLYILEWYQ